MTDVSTKRRGGRRAGVPNRFTSDMRWATLEVFRMLGGIAWLKDQAEEYPVEFMHLLGKLLPKPVEVSGPEGEPVRIVVVTGVPKGAQMTSETRGTLMGDPTEAGRAGSS